MSTLAPHEPSPPSQDSLRDLLHVAAFAIVLLLPAAGMLLDVNDFELLAENRRPAQRPALPTNFSETRGFPAAFERWFDDHFGFRSHLVGRDKRLIARFREARGPTPALSD